MSLIIRCDGCGNHLKPSEHAITGERVGNAGGAGMPSGRFDLCSPCGQKAFAAIAKTSTP